MNPLVRVFLAVTIILTLNTREAEQTEGKNSRLDTATGSRHDANFVGPGYCRIDTCSANHDEVGIITITCGNLRCLQWWFSAVNLICHNFLTYWHNKYPIVHQRGRWFTSVFWWALGLTKVKFYWATPKMCTLDGFQPWMGSAVFVAGCIFRTVYWYFLKLSSHGHAG